MRFLKNRILVIAVFVFTNAHAEEWVDFKADGGIKTMIDVESIRTYPSLVFAVTKIEMGTLSVYQTILYACRSRNLYHGSSSAGYPILSTPPNPVSARSETSDDLRFGIHTYCDYTVKGKEDIEFPISMLGDDTDFETVLLKDTEIKGDHVLSWTARYKVSKRLISKPKNSRIAPMYSYKTNLSDGYLMNHLDVNCSNKSLRLLASHKYDKAGNVISSMTQPKTAMETIPKSGGRFIADFLCSLSR